MATSRIWLTGDNTINVEMSAEDVANALDNAAGKASGTLARLSTGDGQFEYVNPAHVIRARDTDDDGPYVTGLDIS